MKPTPSQAYLRECFDYEAETGYLRWRRRPDAHFPHAIGRRMWLARFPGQVAGSKDRYGHLQVEIDHKVHMVSRVIWKLVTGKDAARTVDHGNRIRDDNRWLNLRLATQQEQCRNARHPVGVSGFTGVQQRGRLWRARLTVNGRTIIFSGFATAEAASAAREEAASKIHGEFYTT